jgi:amidase
VELTGHESVVELSTAIARGALASRDVLEFFLDRCASSTLNAVVTVDADAARTAADRADAAVRGSAALGALHGVPMTVKDAWAVRGMRSTSGLAEFDGEPPNEDAVAVRRLRAAGAVVFGKTNVPPGITGQETANSLFGRTVNPWDPRRTPGGSSGGAAAAVAAGLTALELGSDSGGSVRQPAHCCGIYGHVPTHGLVPLRGHRPQVPFEHVGKDPDLMTAGPLARTADDLQLALDVLVGDDPAVGGGLRFDLPPPRVRALEAARVAIWSDDENFPVDAMVGDCLARAVDELAKAGAVVSEFAPPFSVTEAWEVGFALWVAGASARTEDDEMYRLRAQTHACGLRGQRARAETMTHRDWLRLDEHRHDLQRRLLTALSDVDVLLCPVIPVTAPPHDSSEDLDAVASVDDRLERSIEVNGAERAYLDQLTWSVVVGLAGLPSTATPIGLARDGLPVGVQVVGGRYQDRTTIEFARLLAEVVPQPGPPPAF